MKTIRSLTLAAVTFAAIQVTATSTIAPDSTDTGKKDDRNVMLNAADANKPREIQIGLPSEDVTVYENGLPAVYSAQ